ncbi:NUDIX hydrolase [Aureimonas fodinaquatilis]|uniref:NUDIX hydrolase n=1 Tax=Aureimonas fodinaquatilis TaxID=2565783 RepID=A0A5B0DWE5_9HYPH|nr:NUDIX domain-containing protein [Aureimonas fodinaquatilis]KAA0970131.1 NUDIX hydrolase [Aureimonas fodinaquatilis]
MTSAPTSKPAIRDAASLFIVDDRGSEPLILVGRRAHTHIFMAGKTVFPGGRVDPEDLRLARQFRLDGPAEERLTAQTTRRFSATRPVALALAAIRETYEETGVMIGHKGQFETASPAWQPFNQSSVIPAPELLTPVARAITPPGLPRRYDTRFFAVSARSIAWHTPDGALPTNELTSVEWMSLPRLAEEPLADITRIILAALVERMESGALYDPTHPMVFHRRRNGAFCRALI